MKKLVVPIIAAIFLVSCATAHGPFGRNEYFIRSEFGEGPLFTKAAEVCPNGYDIVYLPRRQNIHYSYYTGPYAGNVYYSGSRPVHTMIVRCK